MSYDIEPHVQETWCTDFGMAHICTDICESILQKYHECAINEGVFVCKKKFINHWKRCTSIHSLLIDFYWLHSKSNPVFVMCILYYKENGRNIIREYDAYISHLGMYRILKTKFYRFYGVAMLSKVMRCEDIK